MNVARSGPGLAVQQLHEDEAVRTRSCETARLVTNKKVAVPMRTRADGDKTWRLATSACDAVEFTAQFRCDDLQFWSEPDERTHTANVSFAVYVRPLWEASERPTSDTSRQELLRDHGFASVARRP